MDIRQNVVYAYSWPSRLFRPTWKVKQAPKRANASFRWFSCAIAHHFLGDMDSDVKNAKLFRGQTSRPFICIRLAITACSNNLEGQTSPEVSIRLSSTIFVCYNTPFLCAIAHHFLGDPYSDVKNAKFFVDVRQELVYAYGWPSRLVRPIWRVKQAPKRAYASFRWFSCAIAHYFLGD